jgi:hypothetical protein
MAHAALFSNNAMHKTSTQACGWMVHETRRWPLGMASGGRQVAYGLSRFDNFIFGVS